MASNAPSLRPGGGACLPELRLVLLGSHGAGKTSAGYTIIGQEATQGPSTALCVTTQGQVAGRRIVLVDTPGWLPLLPLIDTSELFKREIERSASLSPPGPHCLLLVVPLNVPFTRRHELAMREHLGKLFGETAWSHTLVLFTHGDCLENTPIQEVIDGAEALQRLIKKCTNRFHVLNNVKTGHQTQVTELLDKIEQIVRENHGSHYELSSERIYELELKKRTDDIEGEKRRERVQRMRADIQAQIVKSTQKLRILVVGYQYSGKSSTGNTILGREAFSLTRTVRFAKGNAEVADRWEVTVVDTPGRWRIHPVKYTSELFKQEIILSPSQCPPGPHAVLLVLPVKTSFTDINCTALRQHLDLLGMNIWSHVFLLFTCGDWLGSTPVEQFIESEGAALKWLVEQCGNRYHVFNNKQRGDRKQVTELLEKIEEMVHKNSGRYFKMRAPSVDSGTSLDFPVPNFHLVLLGYRRAGQTSSANTILGSDKFSHSTLTQCAKRESTVSDQLVYVVCTPGWEKTEKCHRTPKQNKEIVESINLCSPGPHAFLLVLRASMSFCAETLQAVKEHVELLGEKVWKHTMLLFTHCDLLGDATIEQHIESEGKALKWLVKKCGNRYHVLDNYNRDKSLQVTDLLGKIEEMVVEHGRCRLQVDKERLKEAEEISKIEEEKAREGWKQDKLLGEYMARLDLESPFE